MRIGNGAVDQRQTDVLGEVMDALDVARDRGRARDPMTRWALQRALVNELAEHWERARQRHLGDPRAAAALHPLPGDGLGRLRPRGRAPSRSTASPGPVERWRALRDEVREEILERGFDSERNTFTQHYDTTEVDASLLMMPLVGFLPATTRGCSAPSRRSRRT